MKILGLLLSILTLIACGNNEKPQSAMPGKKTNQPGAGPAKRLPSMNATVVHPMTLRQSSLGLGTLLPAEQAELKTQMAGQVVQILFSEGQRVAAGALLLKLDDAELQANRAKALAKKDYLRINHSRKQRLFEGNALSQQDLESSAFELAQAEAEIKLLDAQIAKTEVRAPFTGELGLRQVSPGAVVTANQTLSTIIQRLPARVEFTAPADQALLVSVGAKIQVRLASGKLVEASVVATEGALSVTTRSLKVRATLRDTEGQIPGSAVEVFIPQKLQQGFMIPADALSGDEKGPLVYVLHKGKATVAPVDVGPRTGSAILILSGINAGDTVLSIGAQNIRPGQIVNILEVRE